jgi:hypothetical protein
VPIPSIAATRAERAAALPGDALIPQPRVCVTHAVTIRRTPAEVWPWIAQMGADRAGWYSYDRLDNGGIASATTIRPELQELAVGDVMPALPGATAAFLVRAVRPPSELVLWVPGEPTTASTDAPVRASWAFVLRPAGESHTRLLVRARLHRLLVALPRIGAVQIPGPLVAAIARPIHFVMQRKQLLGIAARAEGAV